MSLQSSPTGSARIPLTRKKRLSSLLLRSFSPLLDKINHNARFVKCARENVHIPRFRTRDEVHQYINDTYLQAGRDPVDYFEFGVFEGASVNLWSHQNAHPASRFYGFDSFEGLPEGWRPGFDQGHFDMGGQMPHSNDPRVHYVKGWFQHSLPTFLEAFKPQGRLVIHNDSDLYSSTLYCLTAMDCARLIQPGTIIIFDEFGDPIHEFRALHDYASAYMREWRLIAATENFWSAAVEII